MRKTQLVDLLDIADPYGLGPARSERFDLPFQTIESVVVVDAQTLGIANDNNFPFSSGRTSGVPDATEFVLVRLGSPLRFTARAR